MNPLLFMDANLKLVDVAFSVLFLIWILWDALKNRKEFGGGGGGEQFLHRESSSLSAKITVLLSCVVGVSYVVYLLHEFWESVNVPTNDVSSAVAWCSACMLVVYSVSRGNKRWPLVLILWWGFSSACCLVVVVFYFLHRFKNIDVPQFVPEANTVDFPALLLSLLLCFNALVNSMQLQKKSRVHSIWGFLNDGLFRRYY